MKSWLRVVLPDLSYLWLFAGGYLTFVAFVCGFVFFMPYGADFVSMFFWARDLIVVIAAIGYGCYRSIVFHPTFRRDYADFLRLTAWTPCKPLPMGPAQLVWQDGAILFVLSLLIWPEPVVFFTGPCTFFLLAYLGGVSIALQKCHVWPSFYAVCFGLGAAILFVVTPVISMPVLLVVYGIARYGVRQSIIAFHKHDLEDQISVGGCGVDQQRLDFTDKRMSWPFENLAPRRPVMRFMWDELETIPTWHGIAIGLLGGWLSFSFLVPALQMALLPPDAIHEYHTNAVLDRNQEQTLVFPPISTVFVVAKGWGFDSKSLNSTFILLACAIVSFVPFCALFRLSSYITGFASPISLWGRIVTGRWIIPKFDRVFVAPLLILCFPLAIAVVLNQLFIPWVLIAPLCVSVALSLALLAGPNRTKWQLTSPARISEPAKSIRQQKNGLEQI